MKRVLLVSGIGLLGLSAVLLTTGLIQIIIPPTYESAARISIEPEINETPSNEWWVQSEVEKLQSKVVLYQVITNLDLNRKWGEKFKETQLPSDLTYKMLKNQLTVRQHRSTTLFEIRVRTDDPTEASAIANNIAEVYRTQRVFREKEIPNAGEVQKTAPASAKTPVVEIIDQAEPNLRPVRPHPLMKILVPFAGLLAGVLGVVLLMLAVMKKSGDKESPRTL